MNVGPPPETLRRNDFKRAGNLVKCGWGQSGVGGGGEGPVGGVLLAVAKGPRVKG